ncbi:hypothetical protein H2O64_00650 [Kordia sp. YSTF-M3]|uniref:Bacteriocin n=1 Tax=Kordia aestuariivivens TaxID=2759037 RepID=A0ABR7Q3X9_9FLAO|nr:hypothetical protein [Kordia aestuariivivens]MBC8753158.1 hypothetical protein [Kordia aestuariivivens]
MKKQKKLNLRKLSIAKLSKVLSLKGGDTHETTVTGPKTRTKQLSKIPEECNVFSVIAGAC